VQTLIIFLDGQSIEFFSQPDEQLHTRALLNFFRTPQTPDARESNPLPTASVLRIRGRWKMEEEEEISSQYGSTADVNDYSPY
jgi:hypothetical protein